MSSTALRLSTLTLNFASENSFDCIYVTVYVVLALYIQQTSKRR